MKKILVPVMALLSTAAMAQGVRGTATDVTNADVLATLAKTPDLRVSDQQIRVIPINNGEYNVGVGVVHRSKTDGTGAAGAGGGVEHSEITEVYHVISGNGTFVTGGTITGARPVAADNPVVTVLNGPSTNGGAVQGGVSRRLGPGDVVVIPPNTPHWFSAITTDEIVYLVVRMDPHKVLPTGYGSK